MYSLSQSLPSHGKSYNVCSSRRTSRNGEKTFNEYSVSFPIDESHILKNLYELTAWYGDFDCRIISVWVDCRHRFFPKELINKIKFRRFICFNNIVTMLWRHDNENFPISHSTRPQLLVFVKFSSHISHSSSHLGKLLELTNKENGNCFQSNDFNKHK